MQNITMYVVASSTLGAVRDFANAIWMSPPTFTRGFPATLNLRLFSEFDDGTPYDISALSNVASWQAVFDRDFNQSTTPILVADNENIFAHEVTETINGTEYTFTEIQIPIPEMNTEQLVAWLGSDESKSGLHLELVGFDGSGEEFFGIQVKNFTMRNRIYYIGTPTVIPEDYLTAAQMRALVAAGVVFQFSSDNTNWHDTQESTDLYFRVRSASDAQAVWSDGIALLQGATGNDGASAYLYVAYASDANGSNFSTTPSSSLKFRAEIHPDEPIETLTANDFAGKWVKYIGDDGNGVDNVTATTLSPGSQATASLANKILTLGIPKGDTGVSSYTYVAWASDSSGTDFSLTPSNTRKYRAEIHPTTPIASPVASDFAGKWVKALGDDGDNAFVIDDALSSSSENAVQNKVIKAKLDTMDAAIAQNTSAIAMKQSTLTFDSFPTQNSNNPVTSGGVYSAIQEILGGNSVEPLFSSQDLVDALDAGATGAKIYIAYGAEDGYLKRGHIYQVAFLSSEEASAIPPPSGGWSYGWSRGTYYDYIEISGSGTPNIAGRYYPYTLVSGESRWTGWSNGTYFFAYYSSAYGWCLESLEDFPHIITSGGATFEGTSFSNLLSNIDGAGWTVTQLHFAPASSSSDPWADLAYAIGELVASLKFLVKDITPCVVGTCPFVDPTDTITALQSRIAALEAFHFGTLTVSHTGTAPTGAKWSVDSGTTWRNFGTSATLALGSYTVTFKSVTGYTAPSSQSVTITAGGTQTVSVAYTATPTTGTVTLTFSGTAPTGASWTIDGNTYTSGQTATLDPGTYAITYASVTGYDSPSTPTSVTVAAGDTLSLSAEYTEQSQGGADYIVSGASDTTANGDYNLDSSKTGYGSSPVYTNGTQYMHKRNCDGDIAWVIKTAVVDSQSSPPNGIYCVSSASTPPTSGWTGCTVSAGS